MCHSICSAHLRVHRQTGDKSQQALPAAGRRRRIRRQARPRGGQRITCWRGGTRSPASEGPRRLKGSWQGSCAACSIRSVTAIFSRVQCFTDLCSCGPLAAEVHAQEGPAISCASCSVDSVGVVIASVWLALREEDCFHALDTI